MFDLTAWKQTKFYQETKLEGKLETVPLLLKLGLKPEQIAQELDIDLDIFVNTWRVKIIRN
jgi:predicted transposase YdaD